MYHSTYTDACITTSGHVVMLSLVQRLNIDVLSLKLAKKCEFHVPCFQGCARETSVPEFHVFPDFQTEVDVQLPFCRGQKGWKGLGSIW